MFVTATIAALIRTATTGISELIIDIVSDKH